MEYFRKFQESLFLEKIPEGWYNLTADPSKDDVVCLLYENSKWLVFYKERGKRYDVKEFKELSKACDELLAQMLEEKRIKSV
jgi:hypothetical protein